MSHDVHNCTHWLSPRKSQHPQSPPAFRLVYEGASGQQRQTTFLCNPLILVLGFLVCRYLSKIIIRLAHHMYCILPRRCRENILRHYLNLWHINFKNILAKSRAYLKHLLLVWAFNIDIAVTTVQVSCADYVDCREGQPFQMSCGHGAVFDDVLGCVHPDQTNRLILYFDPDYFHGN
jgi:hypothetical protein